MIALSPEEAAYIAGLIDADGTVTVATSDKRRQLPAPMVLVVNGDLALIRWLKAIIGAGCSYETKTRPTRPDQNSANWNKVHRFQITNGKAQELLRAVRPYMRVKHRHADLVLALPIRGRDFKQRATPEQLASAVAITAEVRLLNKRGLKP